MGRGWAESLTRYRKFEFRVERSVRVCCPSSILDTLREDRIERSAASPCVWRHPVAPSGNVASTLKRACATHLIVHLCALRIDSKCICSRDRERCKCERENKSASRSQRDVPSIHESPLCRQLSNTISARAKRRIEIVPYPKI
jgi:hypothetical protein